MSAAGTEGGNQYTLRTSDKRAKQYRDEWKERISAGNILERLLSFADPNDTGPKVELSQTQLKAYELVLDRVAPRLSAVEQTEVNELDTLNREQILERIQALLKADPSLLPELVGLQARESSGTAASATVVSPEMSRNSDYVKSKT